jgi:hypothetical protein
LNGIASNFAATPNVCLWHKAGMSGSGILSTLTKSLPRAFRWPKIGSIESSLRFSQGGIVGYSRLMDVGRKP